MYGLTHNINTFNQWNVQMHHFAHILKQFVAVPGVLNKVWVLLKGPGWSIGKPRLGDPADIPDARAPVIRYDTRVSRKMQGIVLVLGLVAIVVGLPVIESYSVLPVDVCVVATLFSISQLMAVGLLLDGSVWALYIELVALPAVTGLAAYSLQLNTTYFHQLFRISTQTAPQLNLFILITSIVLCSLVLIWESPITAASQPTQPVPKSPRLSMSVVVLLITFNTLQDQ